MSLLAHGKGAGKQWEEAGLNLPLEAGQGLDPDPNPLTVKLEAP